jgi:hypothetical protein
MSDFLSKLVERSVSGSNAVRPQLETIYNFPTEKSGRFFAAEEQRGAMSTMPTGDTTSDRPSRIETMWQSAPQAGAEIASASVAQASLQSAPAAQPKQQQVTSEHHTEMRPPERDTLSSSQTEAPDESLPPSAVLEVRAQKVVELIRRESPRALEPASPRELHAISQSPPRFRTATTSSKAREDLAAPSVHVTIGRVEVRATLPQPVGSEKPRTAPPIMSLEEYLRERAGGNRR